MAWFDDVRAVVQALPPEFTLSDVYASAADLSRGRSNQNVPAKIRQQLQVLRDQGYIVFLGSGRYRHRVHANATVWPFEPGDATTRAKLCSILGLDQRGLDRKGMHKNTAERGRFSRDLILLHESGKNPYQDRWIDSKSMTWIGMGIPEKGDQKYEGFNRYLAEHIELGIRVHLFVQQSNGHELQYYGNVTVIDYRWVFRHDEGRHVWEYDLALEAPTNERAALGNFYASSWESPPPPYVVPGERRLSPVLRRARNRAFGARIRDLYQNRCAVCGDPLIGQSPGGKRELFDLQGAHVRSVSDGGPDEVNNGVCLCSRHHWAFDHGVFSIGRDYEVLVSRSAVDPHEEIVEGAELLLPSKDDLAPHPHYLAWHRENWNFNL